MRKSFVATSALALISTAAWAQGYRGGRGSVQPQPFLDMNKLTVIEGTVAKVNIAFGAQYPSIEVNKNLIKIAPAWFLLENDFELNQGDQVRVVAAPSTIPGDSYLHAIQILNIGSKASLVLRDSSGFPEWLGGRSGPRPNVRPGSGCIDPASVKTVAGTVDKITAGAGIQMPTLVIKLSDGTLLTVKIGPERILLAADFELNVGEKVTAKVALATCSDEWVALELTNEAGKTVVLRDATGAPVWN